MPKFKCDIFGDFQTIIPDRSLLIGQKLVENAKIEKLKYDNLADFKHYDKSQQF